MYVITKEEKMSEDELRELKAYKLGYDLGWFRASEAIKPLLIELEDCIAHSYTWQEVEKECEREGRELPLYMARIAELIADMGQLRREVMPAIVLEQKAINDMGERLEKLSKQEWESLSMKDNSSLDLSNRKEIADGATNNATKV